MEIAPRPSIVTSPLMKSAWSPTPCGKFTTRGVQTCSVRTDEEAVGARRRHFADGWPSWTSLSLSSAKTSNTKERGRLSAASLSAISGEGERALAVLKVSLARCVVAHFFVRFKVHLEVLSALRVDGWTVHLAVESYCRD